MKYVCVHGHFYQPPRENPWSGIVIPQPSARPHRDWNHRVTAECYDPNTHAQIAQGSTTTYVNNFENINFNVGPTLMSWLELNRSDVYWRIIDADRIRIEKKGVGGAIAQTHSHSILPLCSRSDKETQVIWGIKDFKRRFNRFPTGMWLPETAVDKESLRVMFDNGIRYTILAPHQIDIASGDTSRPFRVTLSGNDEMVVFVFNRGLSGQAAFGDMLSNGEVFAELLASSVGHGGLAHIAIDGETFGHHHKWADLALAYAYEHFKTMPDVLPVVYEEYLNLFEVSQYATLVEKTSWSCSHGIERWKSDCGCNAGSHKTWQQQWRTHLRLAVDEVTTFIHDKYSIETNHLLIDPLAARNDYIEIESLDAERSWTIFLDKHRTSGDIERSDVESWLESQRFAMFAHTSCGWFFDDITGIETIQVIAYLYRAVELLPTDLRLTADNIATNLLSAAKTNLKNKETTGKDIWLSFRPKKS